MIIIGQGKIEVILVVVVQSTNQILNQNIRGGNIQYINHKQLRMSSDYIHKQQSSLI